MQIGQTIQGRRYMLEFGVNQAALAGMSRNYIAVMMFSYLAAGTLSLAGRYLVFRKSGIAGWKAVIPFLGGFLMHKIAWRGYLYIVRLAAGTAALALMVLNSIASDPFAAAVELGLELVYVFITLGCFAMLAVRFDKDSFFIVALILFTPLFMLILGSDRSVYRGNAAENLPSMEKTACCS